MAYTVNDNYKNNIYSEDSEQSILIKINNQSLDTAFIRDLKLDDKVFNGNSFALGSAIPCQIELTLDNDYLESIGDFDEISAEFILNEMMTVPLGNYIIVSRSNVSDFSTKFVFNDYLKKLDVEYDISKYLPCTRYEVYEHICEDFNLEVGSDSFINGDVLINVYDSMYKAKDYLMYFSERAGGYCKCIRNKIIVQSFGNVSTHELPSEKCGDYKTDKKKIVSKVVYANATQLFEAGDDTGFTVYLSQDSPLSCTQEEVNKIYESLNGLEFQSLDVRVWGDPSIDTGEIIKLGDVHSFAQKNWTFGNGFYGYYKTTFTEEKSTPNTSKTTSKMRKLQSLIDELNGTISILVKEIYEEDGIINEKFTNIFQDINNIVNSVQNSGGSNLIYNSVMFAMQDGVPENWTVSGDGTLSAQSSPEAFNAGSQAGHTFTLLDKTIKQRVYVKADDNSVPEDQKAYYTFSCKIKKNIVGTCYVKLSNSVEEHIIKLDSGQESFYGDYELKALLPKESYYDIEFYGSFDSNATFTDVMFALGQYKTTWTQANGEIMNTQVVINQNGALVKSSVYEGDYTVMSPLEFAGYSKINGVVTKVFSLNKDTTEVKKLRVEDEVTMPPIKIVPIKTGAVTGWALVKTGDVK